MRDFFSSRFVRILVCLILIGCFLVNSSPIKAKASSLGAALIASVTTVNVPVALCITATLIALGVMKHAADTQGTVMNHVVGQVQSHLETLGGYVKDGTMEMYRVVTETGEVIYYAAADMMESVRSYLFDSKTVEAKGLVFEECAYDPSWALAEAGAAPYSVLVYLRQDDFVHWYCAYSYQSPIIVETIYADGKGVSISTQDSGAFIYGAGAFSDAFSQKTGNVYYGANVYVVSSQWFGTATPVEYISGYDITLGSLLSVPIDGTSAKEWAAEYAAKGLYVINGGGSSENPDDGAEGNDGWKFLLPLSLAALADLLAMTQADQWTAETPQEFDDYTTEEELTVTPAPEIDGYPAIEIAPAPAPNPDTGGNTGSGEDPDTDTDPDTGTESEEIGWFKRIAIGIEELPSKFQSWLSDIKSSITELPSKFESWITDCKTAIQELPQNFSEFFANLGAKIEALPESIASAFQSLFTPSSDVGKFTLDLKQYFPFCIPFDLYAFFTCLNADPVAPVIEWVIPMPGGSTYPLEIDLSVFDSVAQLLRRLQLLAFCVGLAFKTRDLIKG